MTILEKENRIAPFIKEIILLESDSHSQHNLPFYADGYPGIMYSETEKGVKLLPVNKILPKFFLYGQTIEPIELLIEGTYKLIVFQLYPFATRLLLGIDPKDINDECYDLSQVKNIETTKIVSLIEPANTKKQVEIISNYVLKLVKNSSIDSDNSIKLAVSTIINTKGTLPIKELRDQLFITERTFERRFLKEIGVTPKQFAKIIQFSFSLNQIQESNYTKLTNVAYENGFADQSHFIRTFKKYTGATPKELLQKIV
ncbi:helix-turn-helix domain-containing protein [Bernardetia sp. OM2101]|uniref:helix-turn-helix domain-containing protein n=1 Tax=Bernardetia sp. OM2101 TaxID=3344876 RepID=UPI0035D0C7A4